MENSKRSEMLRIQDFADRMGISVWTARAWVRERRVSSCKPVGHILIPSGEVDRLLAENLRPRLDHCRHCVVEAA